MSERANALWRSDGAAPGSDPEYWHLAEQMIQAEDAADAYRSGGQAVRPQPDEAAPP